jgi:surfeit locus 1 family protein
MDTHRKHRTLILIAALLLAALTARLGLWQLDRAAQKQALQTALDARSALPALAQTELALSLAQVAAQHYRPVQLQGHWLPQATVFLDNRQMNGRPGFLVVTPLQLASGEAVLVQRGWVPRDLQDRTRVPMVRTPSTAVTVDGQVASLPGRLFEFAAAASAAGSIRQNLDIVAFATEIGRPLLPLSVLQRSSDGEGLLRQWAAPAVDIHKHHGYAFQWFALSALTIGLYVWFQLIRPHRTSAPS